MRDLRQNRRFWIALVVFMAALIIIALLWSLFFSAPAEPSAPIASVPVDTSAQAEMAAGMAFAEGATVYEIVPGESEVRFLIDEVLRGEPTTVVGRTDQVAGQIALDFADPASAAIGPIRVNARTLFTDNDFRNRAIQNRILVTGFYEFVTFTPTAISGLPETVTTGEAVTFDVTGDLTVTAYTQPVTFAVTATPVSASRLEGTAATTINRSDFDLVVPSATGVADVSEDVTLEIDFVAIDVATTANE